MNRLSWPQTETKFLRTIGGDCNEYLDVIKWRDAERAGTPLAPLNTLTVGAASMSEVHSPCADADCKPIPGFDGYFASSLADIWSFQWGRWHKIKTWQSKAGYRYAGLYRGCRQEKRPVAWFVALAFHGVPPKGSDCRHLDGNRQNDLPGNLAWGSRSQNIQDIAFYGGRSFTVEQVHETRRLARGSKTYGQIAAALGLTVWQVNDIVHGKLAGYIPEPDGTEYQPIRRVVSTSPELKAKIIADSDRGLTIRQIAKKYRITKDRVWCSLGRRKAGRGTAKTPTGLKERVLWEPPGKNPDDKERDTCQSKS